MEKNNTEKQKVVIVVGPTASGKTALSIEIAKKFDGEIISADSRQVYRGLDVGSGKVTPEEMNGVPHHLLDVVDPKDTYTVSDFVLAGRAAIADISTRNKLPIIAGGTFFYVDALLGKIQAPEVPPNPALREKLETMGTNALYTVLLQNDPARAADIDPHNKRRLVRALEIVEALGKVPPQQSEPLFDVLTIGIDIPKERLRENIHQRLIERVENQGMIEEAERLHKNGLSYERMEDLGLEYRYLARFLQKHISKEEMVKEIDTKSRQFAKRQMTWLKNDKDVKWFGPTDSEAIFSTIQTFLQN